MWVRLLRAVCSGNVGTFAAAPLSGRPGAILGRLAPGSLLFRPSPSRPRPPEVRL